ncbi:unnamed protein product [Larinioides sclopetarius]|uniref:MATH domain-containing protein n=1 Tax=Larinioides sclopetarius TaxID=280406 RepID=A0AAV1YSH9_9ARAC
MASNENEIQVVLRNEKVIPDGHEINYSFTVHRAEGCEMKSFALEFNTTCASPSSWSFGFFYSKDPESKKITCSVTLTRKDSGKHAMDAFALVTFLDAEGRVARFSESVCGGQMSAGDVKQGSISDNDTADLINRKLTVRFSITVSKCHKPQ